MRIAAFLKSSRNSWDYIILNYNKAKENDKEEEMQISGSFYQAPPYAGVLALEGKTKLTSDILAAA